MPDSNTKRLKPCPFCGNTDAEVYDYSNTFPSPDHPLWEVGCPVCGFWGYGDSEDEVIAAWNRRYPHESVPVHGAVHPVLSKRQDVRYVTTWECPTCGGDFIGVKDVHFCYHCGQSLKWEDGVDLPKEDAHV